MRRQWVEKRLEWCGTAALELRMVGARAKRAIVAGHADEGFARMVAAMASTE